MTTKPNLKNKRVLVFGLGLLGGGIATTNWLLENGAQVTVTDLKDAKTLSPAIKRVQDHLKKIARDGKAYNKLNSRLSWALGGHSNALIDSADIIIVNPDVASRNPYIAHAVEQRKQIYNEGSLFYDHWRKKAIGVTGTRGKTTVANWIHHLVPKSLLAGNSTTKPFQAVMDERASVAVTELSSFVLEQFDRVRHSPNVAVITNLYQDHLNRHGTMEGYAQAKAAIFAHQKAKDWLVLNQDNSEWTGWFLGQQPKSGVRYFSLKPLPLDLQGIWYDQGNVYERESSRERIVMDVADFANLWGEHNVANLMAAALAAHLAGVPYKAIQAKLTSLPQVPYRQEVVYRDRDLTVVNDTTATSPEGGIAALRRWGGPNCVLITGGTDRELDYRRWADELAEHVRPTNTIFLTGSATDKMRAALGRNRTKGIRTYDSLERCWKAARERAGKYVSATILFSPSAKSFELFANEFDRGQQFNDLVKKTLKS